jgi:hypothetical protein
MNSKGLSNMTELLFKDAQLRAEFQSDPKAIIARFNLSQTESRAVLSCHKRLGLVSSNSAVLTADIGALDSWI